MVHSVLLFLLLTLTAVSAQQHQYDDPSITATMEKFSGYTINEPHSFQLTSLSVDAQALQNQVLLHLPNWGFRFSIFGLCFFGSDDCLYSY